MLYDPRWEKPDILDRRTFVAWLETKPPTEAYVYWDYKKCLVGQYLTANREQTGLSDAICLAAHLQFNRIAASAEHDFTFGGALARARKLGW